MDRGGPEHHIEVVCNDDGAPAVVVDSKVQVRKKSRNGKLTKDRGGKACFGCVTCCRKHPDHSEWMDDSEEYVEEPESAPTTSNILGSRQLISEMRAQNFDVIRFATYRTACKLRFIQKRTHLHQVDIWNVIEAFRENGLNCLAASVELTTDRCEALVESLFVSLNKRLPSGSQINTAQSASLLCNWLLPAYDPEGKGRLRVFSIKVALSIVCAGKLVDKLRYIFTQLSDSSGCLIPARFDEYLHEVVTLPAALYEAPSFAFSQADSRCFEGHDKVNINTFLDVLTSDSGPQCLLWWLTLHRMITAEKVFHPVACETCRSESFMGFRYKCQRCHNYHLCQKCFWRGRVSANHSNLHEMKEYTSYKSPAKQLGHSLRKSFRCVPNKMNSRKAQYPETPEKTIDLSYIVPPTPTLPHNGIEDTQKSHQSLDVSSMDSSFVTKSVSRTLSSLDSSRIDDEHRLIARYAARLAADSSNMACTAADMNCNKDSAQSQRELIRQLEAKNREISLEIQKLRAEQEAQAAVGGSGSDGGGGTPDGGGGGGLMTELQQLRERRDELEGRMSALQDSRRELVTQLETLMKLLKNHSSPRVTPHSTPASSPRCRVAQSPPPLPSRVPGVVAGGDSLTGLGGDVRDAFSQGSSSGRSLRNDLLVAADSVTNAMSSLVKELHSGEEASSGSEEDIDRTQDAGSDMDEFARWQQEVAQGMRQESDFLRELQARKQPDANTHHNDIPIDSRQTDYSYRAGSESKSEDTPELYRKNCSKGASAGRYTTDDDSCFETDQESYIRTDDEEGGNTDWEEGTRRWVNR